MEKIYSREEIEAMLSARDEGAYSNGSPEGDARAMDIADRNFKLTLNAHIIIRQLLAKVAGMEQHCLEVNHGATILVERIAKLQAKADEAAKIEDMLKECQVGPEYFERKDIIAPRIIWDKHVKMFNEWQLRAWDKEAADFVKHSSHGSLLAALTSLVGGGKS